ncbi:MAG: hypothetical protein ACRDQ1_17075 [Sciscionella sp.]
MAFVAAAARALAVRPDYLYGLAEPSSVTEPHAVTAGIIELRGAFDAYDDPRPEGNALSLALVVRRLRDAAQQVSRLRYAEAGRELPNLLHHLYVLDEPGVAGEPTRAALHDAYRLAATVAGRFGQSDLAAVASERHRRLAPETGDPLRVAISAYHRSTHHLRHGSYDAGSRILRRAFEALDATGAGRAVAVQLHVRSAVLAARAARSDVADEHIDAARALLAEHSVPASPYYNINADPLNVDVHWCALPVENYDGAESLRRAGRVRVADPAQPERVGHHHVDMARAWLLQGDREQVLANLDAARRIAPHNTRHHPAVRETVLALAESDRRSTGSLAGFARWAGIDM